MGWLRQLKVSKPLWKLTTRNGRRSSKKTVGDYEQQMSQTEERFKVDFKKRNDQFEVDTFKLNDKHKKEIDASSKKYADLKKTHEREVHDLSQNVGTLKFVKEMRFFKKQSTSRSQSRRERR